MCYNKERKKMYHLRHLKHPEKFESVNIPALDLNTEVGISALTAKEMDQVRRETCRDDNETDLFLPALTGEVREPAPDTPVLDALWALFGVVLGIIAVFAYCLTP